MLVGDKFVYQIRIVDDGVWLLLLALPILLFLGYQLAKLAYGDREYAEPSDVVVMPPDLIWMNYTNDLDLILEITRAVIHVRQSPPVRYEQIAIYLKSERAHQVAMRIGVFHVYREREIRAYMSRAFQGAS